MQLHTSQLFVLRQANLMDYIIDSHNKLLKYANFFVNQKLQQSRINLTQLLENQTTTLLEAKLFFGKNVAVLLLTPIQRLFHSLHNKKRFIF